MLKMKALIALLFPLVSVSNIAFGEAGREPSFPIGCQQPIGVNPKECRKIIAQYYQNNLEIPQGYEIINFKDETPGFKDQLTFTYSLKSHDGEKLCPGGQLSTLAEGNSICFDNVKDGRTPAQIKALVIDRCLTTAKNRLRHVGPTFCGTPL